MANVGQFGSVKFYTKVSGGKLAALSFSNLKWDTSINVEEHKRYGKKPFLETVSRNCDEITMDIYLMANLGVKPLKSLLQLRSYNLAGKVYLLKLGGKRIGSFKWIITNISNNVKTFSGNGKITGVVASVTFKEYPYKKGTAKKKKVYQSELKDTIRTADQGNMKDTINTGASVSATTTSSKITQKKGSYISYTVKKGDTLWALAKKYYGKGTQYTKIYNANKKQTKGFHVISNPSKIQPGWVIKIPK